MQEVQEVVEDKGPDGISWRLLKLIRNTPVHLLLSSLGPGKNTPHQDLGRPGQTYLDKRRGGNLRRGRRVLQFTLHGPLITLCLTFHTFVHLSHNVLIYVSHLLLCCVLMSTSLRQFIVQFMSVYGECFVRQQSSPALGLARHALTLRTNTSNEYLK